MSSPGSGHGAQPQQIRASVNPSPAAHGGGRAKKWVKGILIIATALVIAMIIGKSFISNEPPGQNPSPSVQSQQAPAANASSPGETQQQPVPSTTTSPSQPQASTPWDETLNNFDAGARKTSNWVAQHLGSLILCVIGLAILIKSKTNWLKVILGFAVFVIILGFLFPDLGLYDRAGNVYRDVMSAGPQTQAQPATTMRPQTPSVTTCAPFSFRAQQCTFVRGFIPGTGTGNQNLRCSNGSFFTFNNRPNGTEVTSTSGQPVTIIYWLGRGDCESMPQ